MKKESFPVSDLNTLFHSVETMHDETITHIEISNGCLIVEYGEIGKNDYYKPFNKVTVTYELKYADPIDYNLYVYKIKNSSLKYITVPEGLDWLNEWNMLMFKYDIDIWGEMCIYFNIDNGKKYYNVEFHFTPESIEYCWEE